MEVLKKKTLIVGNGGHQHDLIGKISVKHTEDDIHILNGNTSVNDVEDDFIQVNVLEDTLLKHQTKEGKFGEHNTLELEKGLWVSGKQVEFNPFDGKVSRVWD
jgi:hypothetical protein